MSERSIVGVLMDKLKGIGWRESSLCPNYVRGSMFIEEVLKASFKRLNEKTLNAEGLGSRLDKVFDRVKDLLENAEPHVFLEYLRRGVDVEEGKKKVRVRLLDYGDIENNDFTMCREVLFYGEHMDIRPDFVLYVNGIPLVVIEVENPFRLGERAVEEGVGQLLRYEREVPQLFKYVQIGIVYTDEETSVYMPMMRDWRGKERWYGRWRNKNGDYSILDLLKKERILEVLRWFTFYKGADKKGKVIPRYNQYWATVKAMDRIVSYLEGRDRRNRGLIWHWQGSGKTYIMFYIAYQFFMKFFDRDPVVFFVVDRRDLQRQLYDEFIKDIYAPDFQERVKVVNSIEELRSILREIGESELNELRVCKGIYVVLIQKFRPRDLEDLQPIDKKEVLLLIDEAHRSHYGDLGATVNKLLPNAIRFAFTGTPVMSYERNTFEQFSYTELGELYLDKYFISNSIRDGYTLPLKYQVVQEIGGVRVNIEPEEIKELLETWARNAYELGSLDDLIEEEEEEYLHVTKGEIRRRLNKIRVFLENPERLRRIAEYIAERIVEDTENFRFKALVVVASRLACVRMKRALDEALVKRYGEGAKKWSEVVMTYVSNEREDEIREYLEELLNRWRGYGEHVVRDWEEVNRVVQDSFKEREDPRILIVTDMLITGFDFPKLKVMYLDKPLYEHRLLQAIARVNRPYKAKDLVKEFGLVVDFVGLLENVKETIVKYELLDTETYRSIYEESVRALDSALEELEFLIEDVKQRLRRGISIGVHRVELDLDKLRELLGRGLDVETYRELDNAAKLLALGYATFDLGVVDLLTKMKRACNLYRALGAHKEKLRFYDYVIITTKLYNAVLHRLRGVGPPESFWKELLKAVHSRTTIPEIALVEECTVKPESLEEILKDIEGLDVSSPQASYVAAETLLTIKGLLDLEPANPVYKYIYERLKKLEEEWSARVDRQLLSNIKNVAGELLDYLRKRSAMKLSDRLVYDVVEYLCRRLNTKIDELKNFEETINKVINTYKSTGLPKLGLFQESKKQIKVALLKDIFKLAKIPPQDAHRMADELVDYVERVILHELRRLH
ncbi:MAG: HsdR family type I site-specific deoxyribonuclease [Desulfurococcaceae archaeon]|nr:HsdR family type I site-specific deoxyribonuclease [Desulfurococcaceae archaeon]